MKEQHEPQPLQPQPAPDIVTTHPSDEPTVDRTLERAERIALLLTQMRLALRDAPDKPLEEGQHTFDTFFAKNPSSAFEVSIAHSALSEYFERRAFLKSVFEARTSDEALFEETFGKKPLGDIRATVRSLVINFVCDDPRDYFAATNSHSNGIFLNSSDQFARKELAGKVTICNNQESPMQIWGQSRPDPMSTDEIARHEEEHALFYFLTEHAKSRLGLKNAGISEWPPQKIHLPFSQSDLPTASSERVKYIIDFLVTVIDARFSSYLASEMICRVTDGKGLESAMRSMGPYLLSLVQRVIKESANTVSTLGLTDDIFGPLFNLMVKRSNSTVKSIYTLLDAGTPIDYVASLMIISPTADWERLFQKASVRHHDRSSA